jgi:hypothetical protein
MYCVKPLGRDRTIVGIMGGHIVATVKEQAWEKAEEHGIVDPAILAAARAVDDSSVEVDDDEQLQVVRAWDCDANIAEVRIVRLK